MSETKQDTFHHVTHAASGALLGAGDVIRIFDGPFGDAVILGFNEAGEAKLARPYAFASSVGTTSPTGLLGAESIVYTVSNLKHVLSKWPRLSEGKVTGHGRTEPAAGAQA